MDPQPQHEPRAPAQRLAQLDQAHVWHPFTPMRQWREQPPTVIDHALGPYLYDLAGHRYIDGVSSLWCNVHGHRVPEIDRAIRDQLDRVAHTTLLGLASPPSIELAARLCAILRPLGGASPLNKVFYSDAGATAVEAAIKMAVGHWHHRGRPQRRRLLALGGAYHGDTAGAMSVGFSDLYHRPYAHLAFPVHTLPMPDPCRPDAELLKQAGGRAALYADGRWPSEQAWLGEAQRGRALAALAGELERHGRELAAAVVEPLVQGAAGILIQPPGFLAGAARLLREAGALLIADEVATGFGRTGALFACEHEAVAPDLLCLGKGLTGGYLPLAATLATDEVEDSFTGEIADRRTFFHGHTYTGNALACAAALASLDLFASSPSGRPLLEHVRAAGEALAAELEPLRECSHVMDLRRCGLMVGIELGRDRLTGEGYAYERRVGYRLCMAMRARGVFLRPIGDVVILMPILAAPLDVARELGRVVRETILGFAWPVD